MTIAQQIRDTLAAGPLPFRKLHEKVGGDDMKLRKALSNLEYNGWLTVGKDDDKTIKLAGRKAAPPQGRRSTSGKKSAGKKKSRKLTIRKIAERIKQTPPAEQFRDILLDNLIGAGALLRQAIEDGVEDLDQNFAVKNAIANQQRAEQILAAGRSA